MSENKELIELLDAMKESQSQENIAKLTAALDESEVFVPAVMPEGVDEEALKNMAENTDEPKPMPQPCLLQDNHGRNFFPIFTSQEELEKGDELFHSPLRMKLPFKVCMDLILQNPQVAGAAINPFSQNVMMNVNRNDAPKQENTERKNVEISEAQMHVMIRQQMEAQVFPARLFEGGEEFYNDLREREGECMVEFFEKPYEQSGKCPYTADDYDFMALQISDTLQVVRITMPEVNQYPGTAITTFVTWNPEAKKAGYYCILKGARGDFNKLMERCEDGTVKNHGDAPNEGGELQYIIDLASAK